MKEKTRSLELRRVLKLYLDAFLAGEKTCDNTKLQMYFYVSSSTSTRDKDRNKVDTFFSYDQVPLILGRQLREQGQGFKKKGNKAKLWAPGCKEILLKAPLSTHQEQKPDNKNPKQCCKVLRGNSSPQSAKPAWKLLSPKCTLQGAVQHTHSASGIQNTASASQNELGPCWIPEIWVF